jgi:hypothetical protein
MKTKNEKRTTNKMEYTRFYADIVARDAFADPGATMRTWFGSVQGESNRRETLTSTAKFPPSLQAYSNEGWLPAMVRRI